MSRVRAALSGLAWVAACGLSTAGCATRFAPIPRVPMPRATTVPRCEAVHALRGTEDRVDTRIERLDDSWLVSLRMHLELGPGLDAVDLYGLGQVTFDGRRAACSVLEAGAQPGSPRFDQDLCLDAVESIADLLEAAESSAQPGQTVIEEGTLVRAPIRRRARARRRPPLVVVRIDRSAVVTRDAQGRAVNVVQEGGDGTREYVQVHYAPRHDAHCVPSW